MLKGSRETKIALAEIICIGGGGHFTSCADVIQSSRELSIIGIIDVPDVLGKCINGVKIIGTDEDLGKFSGKQFLVTVGFVKDGSIRKRLYERAVDVGLIGSVIISVNAYVAPSVSIDPGTIVMHHALVNSDSRIGCNVIVNTKALIEHDCIIGAHSHIAPGAIVTGGCHIGSCVLVGSGAVIKHGISICDDVIVGAGAVVVHDILERGIWVGNPARRIVH